MASDDSPRVSTSPNDGLYRAYVGANAAAYVAYFTRRDDGRSWISWHWPSTVVAFHWALYRKQWLYALSFALVAIFALMGFAFHAAALANATADDVATFSSFWLSVALAAVLIPPVVTKPLYYRAARAAIARTAHLDAVGEQVQALARQGGTSRGALWIGLVLTCLLPIGLAVLGS